MTATLPARSQTAYRGVVYGIDLLDHRTRQVTADDYIGQTRQRGRARENQHRDDKPWSDLIVGSSHVLWEGICTDAELDAIEKQLIVERCPRMNWVHNEHNPNQVPKWVQLEQRHARDDAAGRPRWVPPDQRSRESLLDWDARESTRMVAVRPRAVTRRWSSAQVKAVLWSSVWAVSTSVLWVGFHHYGLLNGWRQRALCACLLSTILWVWIRLGAPVTKRQWRRRRRRLWRQVKRRAVGR